MSRLMMSAVIVVIQRMTNIIINAKHDISALLVGLESRHVGKYALFQTCGVNTSSYANTQLLYSISVYLQEVNQFEDWCSG